MTDKLEINTAAGKDACRLSVKGDLDMDSSPQLLDAIRGGLKRSSCLELNLKETRYVDSSGIAVLVQGFKLARQRSAEYVLLDPSAQLMAVIRLSQLQNFFTIKTSEEAG